MVKLELLAPAQLELEEIALVYLKLARPDSAHKITERIYSALERLQKHPNLGVVCYDKQLALQGYRMLICESYLCFYRLVADTLYIYHIVDGRANYPKLLNDIKQK